MRGCRFWLALVVIQWAFCAGCVALSFRYKKVLDIRLVVWLSTVIIIDYLKNLMVRANALQ
ncbi:hypothetical protein CCP2SC5_840002 [Azospirillaceae bacterium]